jgi:hypothetical protein
MPCERAEQPLSRSALEDTGTPAPMEILMAGSPEDICLLACNPQSPGTHGGPGAALSWERKREPRGHAASLELPRDENRARATGTRGSFGAALSWEAAAVVLSLYAGVLGPQGTDSGLWAHLGRGCEPAGGANILSPRSLSESLCAGILKQWCSATDAWRPTIHVDVVIARGAVTHRSSPWAVAAQRKSWGPR